MIGLLAFLVLSAQGGAAQENALPADVLNAYSAYEAAVADSDWDAAVDAARTAAEAGEHHGIDAASQAVLWENLGIAYLRSGARPETEGLADAALERALALTRQTGDEAGSLRLRFRLVESASAAQDGMLVLDRMNDFEAALSRSSIEIPELERRYLSARLHGTRPISIFTALPMSDGDRTRTDRLLELAIPGSSEYVIAQYRRTVDAFARQSWQEAEALVFETADAVAHLSPDDQTTAADVLSVYHQVLARGFDNPETSGAERWPDHLRAVWCGYLQGRAMVVRRTPPQYPGRAAENGWTGEVSLTFRVDEYGQLADIISAEPLGNTQRVFIRSSEQALRRWQWRPQCNPRPGVTITDSTVIAYEMSGGR